jgi:hypothetical protein
MKPGQQWGIAVPVLIVGYVLSPIPTLWTVERIGGRSARDNVALTVYLPLAAACRIAPSLDRNFYAPQDNWLRGLIGDP